MITVLGASGFIGSHLVAHLRREGIDHNAVGRDEGLPHGELGHIVYCIGVTGDFLERPWDTVDAHVCTLLEVVRSASFASLLYLSSTRLYGTRPTAHEEDVVHFDPMRSDLYDLSKGLGEAMTLALGERGRIARLSHVYGAGHADSFLPAILTDVRRGAVEFRSAPESTRDCVSVDDVAPLLAKIATAGTRRVYNVASGAHVTNQQLGDALARKTGCRVTFRDGAPVITSPHIDTERIRSEFGFVAKALLDELPSLLADHPAP